MVRLIDEARRDGASQRKACSELGLDVRTFQRWKARNVGDDRRHGPKKAPSNKLTEAERKKVVEVATSPVFRDLSPKQIVPKLADAGQFVASESTFYRVLSDEGQLAHRGRANAPTPRLPTEHVASAPCQVWSWDITYLRSPVAGVFYYLYMFVDVWSRKVVGFEVHEVETSELAADVLERVLAAEGITRKGLVVHQDNGAPMKGASFKATMERLGIVPSFSRPRVSDDNPYSESLFKTLKYRPHYPRGPFASLEAARAWVAEFVAWYNDEHLHSAIGFVTPSSRHTGRAEEVLRARRAVYERARRRRPERWARSTGLDPVG
jgi:putative transposase